MPAICMMATMFRLPLWPTPRSEHFGHAAVAKLGYIINSQTLSCLSLVYDARAETIVFPTQGLIMG